MTPAECLASDELNLFLSRQLSPGEREGIELHLSRCAECRKKLVSVYDLSKTPVTVHAPHRLKARVLRIAGKRRRGIIPSLILDFPRRAAAAIAVGLLIAVGVTSLFFLSESRRVRQLPTSDVLREESHSVPAPQLLAPSAGEVVTADQLQFRWSKSLGASRYVFTLLDEKGDIVFQTSTTEERLVLNAASISFERGKPYFWYVQARLPDGTTVDSAIGKFAITG